MPHPCPKTCSRLATAAVFVSVGVVQLIAGLILLKSKYVSLLSGPDFWTAASNFAVGILLGISTSVWKDLRKTSSKHVVRRNLLASLVISAMIINSTTAIILILGEGNTLLSIRLENDGNYSSTSEILAYSYATSICSPIVVVVVAIVYLSGMWFRVSDKGMKTPEIKSILKNNTDEYNWVFKGRQSSPKQNSKFVRKELSFKSLSSSSDEESFSLIDAKLWSNSVRSIEYLNTSSRRDSSKIGIYRHCQVHQELACECGEHAKNNSEIVSHETRSMSFANKNKTRKFPKFSPYISRSLLETDNPFCSNHIETGDKKASSLNYADFKKIHQHFENSIKHHKKRRILLKEHPAFQQSKFHGGSKDVQNSHRLDSPEVYIPRAHTRTARKPNPRASEVKAEVHVDRGRQDWIVNENTSESPVVLSEGGVPFYDTLTETTQHKNLHFQKSSTYKKLKSSGVLQSEDNDAVDRKVWRTSTTAGSSSSRISHLDISDIQNDSAIDQNEPYESEEEMNITAVASPKSATLQRDSNIDTDDSFIDEPQSNALAGEVVKVQVNSLPRTPFHSKLIPVPIPVISSVKKKTLNRKQKDEIVKVANKFSSRNELRFSSFHGNLSEINQGNHHNNADWENLMNQKAIDHPTICEISLQDSIPPSPAHTSGYDSAIFETTQLSGSESFKPHLASSETNSSYNTPKRKFQNFPSPRNLSNEQHRSGQRAT